MNKKIFSLILLVFCIFVIVGCEKQTNNDITNEPITNDKKPLEIESVYTTRLFTSVLNKDDYENIKFYSSSGTIEMNFNQEIIDDDYTLGFFAGGLYYPIKSEFDEENFVFYKYTLEKNKLVIRPLEYYHQYDPIEALYIPDTIKSIDNASLSKEHVFLLSRDKEINSIYIENSDYELNNERNFYSLSIRKNKKDGKDLAYVNNNNTLIYSKNNEDSNNMKAFMGENVIIKDETKDMYLVNMYIKSVDKTLVNKDFNLTTDGDYSIIEGYINKLDLNKVPEPLNDVNSYLVKTSYYNDMAPSEFSIGFYMYNGKINFQFIKIFKNTLNVDVKDLYTLESTFLSYWLHASSAFAESHLSSVSNLNSELPKLDKNAHMPEINWREEEYNNYIKSYEAYCNCIINMLKNYKITEEMEGYFDDLLFDANIKIILEQTWKDWGYKNKLENENYIFEELFNRLKLTKEQIIQIQNILKEAENDFIEQRKSLTISEEVAKNMLFEKKLYSFINNFNYDNGVRKFNNYIGEILNKKYQYGEIFNISSYEQMKKDAIVYFEEQKRLLEISQQEEEKRIQAVIDSGSDILEVDDLLKNIISLSDEEKNKLYDMLASRNGDFERDIIYCTIEEKQSVKGKCQVLLKVKINGIKGEESDLLKGNIYNVIYTYDQPTPKDVLNVGDKLNLGIAYKKDNLNLVYFDYFMVVN